MKPFAGRIVQARWFEPAMIALILFNAVLIGLETSHELAGAYGPWLELGNDLVLAVFIAEAALRLLEPLGGGETALAKLRLRSWRRTRRWRQRQSCRVEMIGRTNGTSTAGSTSPSTISPASGRD